MATQPYHFNRERMMTSLKERMESGKCHLSQHEMDKAARDIG